MPGRSWRARRKAGLSFCVRVGLVDSARVLCETDRDFNGIVQRRDTRGGRADKHSVDYLTAHSPQRYKSRSLQSPIPGECHVIKWKAAAASLGTLLVLIVSSAAPARAEEVEKKFRVGVSIGGYNTQSEIESDSPNLLDHRR